MRFLLDEGISPVLAVRLAEAGHDATHVRDLGFAGADDTAVIRLALQQRRVLITEDVGFGRLVVMSSTDQTPPSVVLFRDHSGRAKSRSRLLLSNFEVFAEALSSGAIVVIEEAAIRIHRFVQEP